MSRIPEGAAPGLCPHHQRGGPSCDFHLAGCAVVKRTGWSGYTTGVFETDPPSKQDHCGPRIPIMFVYMTGIAHIHTKIIDHAHTMPNRVEGMLWRR